MIWKKFAELSGQELYDILELRQRVFVLEQRCFYLDCDGVDQKSWHLQFRQQGVLVAYLRLVDPGVKYAEASIGRVVTAPEVRGKKLGQEIMAEALLQAKKIGAPALRISAQSYLQKFYENFGFRAQGSEYLEDDIPHIEMLRDKN